MQLYLRQAQVIFLACAKSDIAKLRCEFLSLLELIACVGCAVRKRENRNIEMKNKRNTLVSTIFG